MHVLHVFCVCIPRARLHSHMFVSLLALHVRVCVGVHVWVGWREVGGCVCGGGFRAASWVGGVIKKENQ